MAIAGRVSIVPQGQYVDGKEYKRLDLVTFNGSAYIAKVANRNQIPMDGDIWMYAWHDAGDTSDIAERLSELEELLTPNGTALNKNFEEDSSVIQKDGVASVGASENIARADHVHPTDDTRLAFDGDSKENTVTFPSSDILDPSALQDVDALESGEKHNSLFGKISKISSNVRYLAKNFFNKANILESLEDISMVDHSGTVPDSLAIKELNSNFDNFNTVETVNIVAYPYLKTNIRVDKIGKIAIMQYISDLVQLPAGETLLATLPDGFKPINVFLTTAHQGANVQITVMPDGRILAYNYTGAAITKVVTCRFSLPYITKNEY